MYQQNNGVAMTSLLGPILAITFMVEQETKIIPTVTNSISHWRRYVNDTIVFIKNRCVEPVLVRLNQWWDFLNHG